MKSLSKKISTGPKCGLRVKFLWWEDALWLGLEAYVLRYEFAAALEAIGKSLGEQGALEYITLEDWRKNLPNGMDDLGLFGALTPFLLADNASVQFELPDNPGHWLDTGRRMRFVVDPVQFAKDNGGTLLKSAKKSKLFCHLYSAELRESAASALKDAEPVRALGAIMASLAFGREFNVSSNTINLDEPTNQSDFATIMELGNNGGVTNVQSLNGMLLRLPSPWTDSQDLPESVKVQLQSGTQAFHFSLQKAVKMKVHPNSKSRRDLFEEYPFEKVQWEDVLETGQTVRPVALEFVANRAWTRYEQFADVEGARYFKVEASGAPVTSADATFLFASLPDDPADAFRLSIGTMVDGRLEKWGESSAKSNLWIFKLTAKSREVLGPVLAADYSEPFLTGADESALFYRGQGADVEKVGYMRMCQRGQWPGSAASDLLLLVQVDASHKPKPDAEARYEVYISGLPELSNSGAGDVKVSLACAGRWNALRVTSSLPTAVQSKSAYLAHHSDVRFQPTNTTETVELVARATSPDPLQDFTGANLIGAMYKSLRADARSFSGLELNLRISDPNGGPVLEDRKLDRAFPISDTEAPDNAGIRAYRLRFRTDRSLSDLAPTDPTPYAAASWRVKCAGKIAELSGKLLDVYGRSRTFGRRELGQASLTVPLRIGVFPPAISAIALDQRSLALPGSLIRSPLPLISATFVPAMGNSANTFTLKLRLNGSALGTAADKQVEKVWDPVADALTASQIVVRLYELQPDNREFSAGGLALVPPSTPADVVRDVTDEIKTVLASLLASEGVGAGDIDIPIPALPLQLQGERPSSIACVLQIVRNPDVLATSPLTEAGQPCEPVLVRSEKQKLVLADDVIDFGGAFDSFKEEVKQVQAPLHVPIVSAGGVLPQWHTPAGPAVPALLVPPDAMWPIPRDPDSLGDTSLMFFVCAAPRLDEASGKFLRNMGKALELMQAGDLGDISAHPEIVAAFVSALQARVLAPGPIDLDTGLERPGDSQGAWTQLLNVLAKRFDVVHGKLDSTSPPTAGSSALPQRIPEKDVLPISMEPEGTRAPVGPVLRRRLVEFWRNKPAAAWNRTAAIVQVLSHATAPDPENEARAFISATTTFSCPTNPAAAAVGTMALGRFQVSLDVTPIDRNDFISSVQITGAVARKICAVANESPTDSFHAFRFPAGDAKINDADWDNKSQILLPATSALQPAVGQTIGIEAGLVQKPVDLARQFGVWMNSAKPLSLTSLLSGRFDEAAGADAYIVVGFAQAGIPDRPFTSFRSFTVAVHGDTATNQPFDRDSFALFAEDLPRASRTLPAKSFSSWDELRDASEAEIPAVVNRILAAAATVEEIIQQVESLSAFIKILAGELQTDSSESEPTDEPFAVFTLLEKVDSLNPTLTLAEGAPISHTSVAVLRPTANAAADSKQVILFVTLGYPITSRQFVRFMHDRDALWSNQSKELIRPAFAQRSLIELGRLLRPRAFESNVMSKASLPIGNGSAGWTVLDAILRQSGNRELVELADSLNLSSFPTGLDGPLSHIYLRLSLQAQIARPAVEIGENGVDLQIGQSSGGIAHWGYGAGSSINSELGEAFNFEQFGAGTGLTGSLIVFSAFSETPILSISGVRLVAK